MHCTTGSTKKNVRISGTCSLGIKTDIRVLFTVFYPSTGRLFTHKWKCSPPVTFHTSHLQSSCQMPCKHVPCNICNCCSEPCFEFIQHIHFLAVHLGFHTAPKKKDQENEGATQFGPPLPIPYPGKLSPNNRA